MIAIVTGAAGFIGTNVCRRLVNDKWRVIGIDKFGASAPYKEIYQNYGLSTENIMKVAKAMLNNDQAKESQG